MGIGTDGAAFWRIAIGARFGKIIRIAGPRGHTLRTISRVHGRIGGAKTAWLDGATDTASRFLRGLFGTETTRY